jgi:hypothetical protein
VANGDRVYLVVWLLGMCYRTSFLLASALIKAEHYRSSRHILFRHPFIDGRDNLNLGIVGIGGLSLHVHPKCITNISQSQIICAPAHEPRYMCRLSRSHHARAHIHLSRPLTTLTSTSPQTSPHLHLLCTTRQYHSACSNHFQTTNSPLHRPFPITRSTFPIYFQEPIFTYLENPNNTQSERSSQCNIAK